MENEPENDWSLTEYRIAHEKHDYYGRTLWQMATIFLTASLAGFGFGLQQNLPLERFIPLTLVLSALLLTFFFQARRLRRLSYLCLLRCREIERDKSIKIVTNQLDGDDHTITIDSVEIKPQKITGKYLNQGTPIVLLFIFWGYIIAKHCGLIP